jgi:hypothetical protein
MQFKHKVLAYVTNKRKKIYYIKTVDMFVY